MATTGIPLGLGPMEAVDRRSRVKTHKRAPAVAASRVIPDISRIEQLVRY
jgi:hypothetical protein